jgi:isochorismate hydrolase
MAVIAAEPYPFDLISAQAGLVIIDMQRDFLEPGGFGAVLGNDVSLLRRTIAPTRRLLDAARMSGLTVIHTREGHRPDRADLPPAKKARGRLPNGIGDPGPMGRILVRGEPGHDIIPELYPVPGEPVVDKPGKGAFHATDLDAMLRTAASPNSSCAASRRRFASTPRSERPMTAAMNVWSWRIASFRISRNFRRWGCA